MLSFEDRTPRRPDLRLAPVDAVEVVRSVQRLMRDAIRPSVTFECQTPGPAALVNIGRRRLEQVLLNVAFHAHDRCAEQGWMRLDVAVTAAPIPGAPLEQEVSSSTYVLLRASDSGPLLTDDERLTLVDVRTQGQRTGLGVACAIVRQAGGLVTADQSAGNLSVNVFLPVVASAERVEGTRQVPPRWFERD